MNVSDPGASRPNYYDRSPLDVTNAFAGALVAPHTSTVRWTYTVPANRKAYVEIGQGQVLRDGVAAPVGQAQCLIRLTPSGGSAIALIKAQIITNVVGDTANLPVASAGLIQAGDVLDSTTVDASTGGTCNYFAGAKCTEFDA